MGEREEWRHTARKRPWPEGHRVSIKAMKPLLVPTTREVAPGKISRAVMAPKAGGRLTPYTSVPLRKSTPWISPPASATHSMEADSVS
jgi:hypothetical protein